jgi:hypothetical protein
MAMKRSTAAMLLVIGLFVGFVALNFVFFVEQDDLEENETSANRSSYRTTPYGLHAYYTLLEESGYPVTRFDRPLTEIVRRRDIGTLLLVSPLPYSPIDNEETEALKQWIASGGQLIRIDRILRLDWGSELTAVTRFGSGESVVRPVQPTIYTKGVNRVSLSRFGSRVQVDSGGATLHIADSGGAVLADVSFGRGRVIILSDPYVVANNGIAEADNVVLAMNLLSDRPKGLIAFEEYHHGYGSAGFLGQAPEGLLSYFKGTPIPWMLAQTALIAALVVYTRGLRFGRPLPVRKERRTTNLEFVSSMANIVRLARASDLAMQNVYSEFHRKLCRYVGQPVRVETPRLAAAVARRSRIDEVQLRQLLMRCEKVMRGEKTRDQELLDLVLRIRAIETRLKI